jgi:hypothetical protein
MINLGELALRQDVTFDHSPQHQAQGPECLPGWVPTFIVGRFGVNDLFDGAGESRSLDTNGRREG